uniref:Uncharacterized protein n=1 Tax=Octopus bimaculoides TaxID=37653 RepID=A0A0L8IH65_OCTBM
MRSLLAVIMLQLLPLIKHTYYSRYSSMTICSFFYINDYIVASLCFFFKSRVLFGFYF